MSGSDSEPKNVSEKRQQLKTIIGTHDNTVRTIEHSLETSSIIISGSWDSTIKIWDPRTPMCMGSYALPDKVVTMSLCGERVVVGTAGR